MNRPGQGDATGVTHHFAGLGAWSQATVYHLVMAAPRNTITLPRKQFVYQRNKRDEARALLP